MARGEGGRPGVCAAAKFRGPGRAYASDAGTAVAGRGPLRRRRPWRRPVRRRVAPVPTDGRGGCPWWQRRRGRRARDRGTDGPAARDPGPHQSRGSGPGLRPCLWKQGAPSEYLTSQVPRGGRAGRLPSSEPGSPPTAGLPSTRVGTTVPLLWGRNRGRGLREELGLRTRDQWTRPQ